ncbi:MAG: tetratricopeptide repeat protein [Acidipila sp.]|nr:tetratricopeptide repeat protein [Acidipila sp.]
MWKITSSLLAAFLVLTGILLLAVLSLPSSSRAQQTLSRQAEVERLKQEVARNPNKAKARIELANALDDAGDTDAAIFQYLAAIRIDPSDASARRNIGVAYLRKGDIKAAEPAFREAIRLAPDYTKARVSLIEVLARKQDWDASLTEITQALRMNRVEFVTVQLESLFPAERDGFLQAKLEAAAHACLGNLILDQHADVDRATKELRKAVEIDPQFAVAFQILAYVYETRNKREDALSAAQTALRLNPNLPNAHLTAGIIYKEIGRTEDAIREYQASIQILPSFAKGYFNLGNLYADLKQQPQAIDAYQKALSADSKFDAIARVHNNLAVCYYVTGQYALAWQHVHDVQRLGGNVNPGFLAALRKAAPGENSMPPARVAPLPPR